MNFRNLKQAVALSVMAWTFGACAGTSVTNPQTATVAPVDRFSDQAGHLFQRSGNAALPAANAAINFDQGPFITQGFGPTGDYVSYYNFDVQPTKAAPIYVLIREGASMPVDNQLNLVDVIPGDAGYNDFWNVVFVTVPANYVANTITSVTDLLAKHYAMQATDKLVNCPVVPAGSTASLRYNASTDTGLHMGWYRGMVVNYFNFSERALTLNSSNEVPLSPIYVTFNKNPNSADPTSGPASGFVTDSATGRTHNVVQTTPDDAGYSPLWEVEIYDNQAFGSVHDSNSAGSSPILVTGAATVNCPIVKRSGSL